MESLLQKLSPGTIPHYSIPHTMGSLAMANAFGVIPYLRNVLEIMLPLLSTLKTDLLKQTFSFGTKYNINFYDDYNQKHFSIWVF